MRVNETLREIYWESKRAPDTTLSQIKNPYKREFLKKKLLGKTKEQRKAKMAEIEEFEKQHIRNVDAAEMGLKEETSVKNETLRQKRR